MRSDQSSLSFRVGHSHRQLININMYIYRRLQEQSLSITSIVSSIVSSTCSSSFVPITLRFKEALIEHCNEKNMTPVRDQTNKYYYINYINCHNYINKIFLVCLLCEEAVNKRRLFFIATSQTH